MTLHTFPQIEQGTEEWMAVRRGIVTASVVGKLITYAQPAALEFSCPNCGVRDGLDCISLRTGQPIKSVHEGRQKIAAAQDGVLVVADNETSRGITGTLAAERITGWTEETAMTPDMWRGVECEPVARDAYSEHYAEAVEVGFMRRDEPMPWDPNEIARPVDEDAPTWSLGYSPDGLVGDDGLIEIKSPRAKTHLRTILADEVPGHYMPQLQAGLLVSGRKWIDFVSFVAGMPLYRKRVTPDPAWFDAITAACIAFEANAAQIVADYEARVADLPKTERIDFEIKVA